MITLKEHLIKSWSTKRHGTNLYAPEGAQICIEIGDNKTSLQLDKSRLETNVTNGDLKKYRYAFTAAEFLFSVFVELEFRELYFDGENNLLHIIRVYRKYDCPYTESLRASIAWKPTFAFPEFVVSSTLQEVPLFAVTHEHNLNRPFEVANQGPLSVKSTNKELVIMSGEADLYGLQAKQNLQVQLSKRGNLERGDWIELDTTIRVGDT